MAQLTTRQVVATAPVVGVRLSKSPPVRLSRRRCRRLPDGVRRLGEAAIIGSRSGCEHPGQAYRLPDRATSVRLLVNPPCGCSMAS